MYQIKHTSRRRHLYMKKEIYQPSQGYPGKPQYGLFLNHKKNVKTKERGEERFRLAYFVIAMYIYICQSGCSQNLPKQI